MTNVPINVYFLALDISRVDKSLKLNIAGAYFFLSNSKRESKIEAFRKFMIKVEKVCTSRHVWKKSDAKKMRLVSTQVRIGGSKKKAKPKQKLLRNSFPATMIRRHCYTLQLIVNEVVFMLIMSDFMSVIRCKLLVVNKVLEYSRTKLLGWRWFQNRPGGTFSNQVGTAYLMGISTHFPLIWKKLMYL